VKYQVLKREVVLQDNEGKSLVFQKVTKCTKRPFAREDNTKGCSFIAEMQNGNPKKIILSRNQ
jgi:hypothetical protein